MNYKRIIFTALSVVAIVLACLLGGCSNDTTKELLLLEVVKPDGTEIKLTYRPERAVWSLLSLTEVKDVEYVTALSSMCAGSFTTESDAESIEATGNVLGEALKALINL